MHTITAWPRPRDYSLYPEKTAHRYRWLLLIVLPLIISGVWFRVGRHQAFEKGLYTPESVADSVSVTERLTAPTSALPGAPVGTAQTLPDARYAELQTELATWVKRQPTSQQWSVVVQDIGNDSNHAEVNAHTTYYMASLYKLFLTLPLSKSYPFTSWQSRQLKTDVGVKSLKDCVEVMISRSDNPCGEAVGSLVGWVNTTKIVKQQGMTDTSLNSSDLRTSAHDVAQYLSGVQQDKWFDAASRQFIMSSLANQKLRAGIPAGCTDCTVLNKTGDLNGVRHDAAIVTHGEDTYALVVMSNGGSYQQISAVSKLVAAKL